MGDIKTGILSSLSRVKALRQSRQGQDTQKPAQAAEGAKAAPKQAKEAKVSKRAEELERQLAELKAEQQRLVQEQQAASAQARRRQAIEYGRKLGARVDEDTLSRILPDVDPGTAEGRQQLEAFRTSNPALFAPVPVKPADVTATAVQRIDQNAKSVGRQPIESRKVFGTELVRATVAKNLGGDA